MAYREEVKQEVKMELDTNGKPRYFRVYHSYASSDSDVEYLPKSRRPVPRSLSPLPGSRLTSSSAPRSDCAPPSASAARASQPPSSSMSNDTRPSTSWNAAPSAQTGPAAVNQDQVQGQGPPQATSLAGWVWTGPGHPQPPAMPLLAPGQAPLAGARFAPAALGLTAASALTASPALALAPPPALLTEPREAWSASGLLLGTSPHNGCTHTFQYLSRYTRS